MATITFSGTFSANEEIILDVEDCTIKDANGSNLRQSFATVNWPLLNSITSTVTYSDGAGSRNLELKVAKQDRDI